MKKKVNSSKILRGKKDLLVTHLSWGKKKLDVCFNYSSFFLDLIRILLYLILLKTIFFLNIFIVVLFFQKYLPRSNREQRNK